MTQHLTTKSSNQSAFGHPLLIAAYTTELHLVRLDQLINCNYSNGLNSTTIIQSKQIVYCSLPSPLEKNYFTIITRDDSNQQNQYQCHLFAVDKELAISHRAHQFLARNFSINCTKDPITGNCLEFLGKFFYYQFYIFNLDLKTIMTYLTIKKSLSDKNIMNEDTFSSQVNHYLTFSWNVFLFSSNKSL